MAWFDDLNLPGSTIDGYFGFVTADGPDENDNPDVMLADGTVTFTATTPAARVNGAWLGIQPVTAQIFEGRLVVSEEEPLPIRLLATDANIGVADWAWKARFDVKGFRLSELTFKAPRDTTVNLTADLIPIKSQPYQIIEGASIVDAEVSGDGTMRFELSDGSYTKWMDVPNGPRGLPGSAGEKGDRGDNGEAATLSMGSVTAGAAADAWMTGPPLARELNLTLPRGQKGDKGDRGDSSITDPQVASYVSAETATKSALRDGFVERHGKRGVTRTLYVRETGDDSNPGTAAAPFREIRAAVDSLAADGPVIRGSVVINVGPGTYKGGIRLPLTRGAAQDDFVKIVGPNVGGHPNVPTAIIDHSADTATSWGIFGEDGGALWLENIKVVGAFSTGVRVDRNTYLWWRNVHIDGQNSGPVGLAVTTHCRYFVAGGIIENCTQNGIQEHFGIVRSFGTVSSAAQQLIVRNCVIGVKAKENCVGHFDYINVEDCRVGIEMQLYSGANMKLSSFKRNGIAIVLTSSEIHNEGSIAWGAGADKNTRRILSLGSSSELALLGWGSVTEESPTLRTGHRPLVTIAADYSDKTITGSTTDTNIVTWTSALRADWYAIQGKHARIAVWGTTASTAPLAANFRIILRLNASFSAEVALPAGLPAVSHFRAEFDLVAAADGASQKILGALSFDGGGRTTLASRAVDLSTADRTVQVSAIPGDASDSVTIRVTELWG